MKIAAYRGPADFVSFGVAFLVTNGNAQAAAEIAAIKAAIDWPLYIGVERFWTLRRQGVNPENFVPVTQGMQKIRSSLHACGTQTFDRLRTAIHGHNLPFGAKRDGMRSVWRRGAPTERNDRNYG